MFYSDPELEPVEVGNRLLNPQYGKWRESCTTTQYPPLSEKQQIFATVGAARLPPRTMHG